MNTIKEKNTRSPLLRWLGWFFLGNTLLFYLIGLHYVFYLTDWYKVTVTPFGKFLIILFLSSAYIGHLALLAFLPCLLLIPLSLIIPRRHFIIIISCGLATFAAVTLITDSFVFAQYRFHLSGVILSMIFSAEARQIFDFSWLEYLLLASIITAIFIVEMLFAYGLWHYFIKKQRAKGYGKWIAIFLSLSLYFSWNMIIFSGPYTILRYFVANVRILPLYNDFLAAALPGKYSSVGLARLGEGWLTQPQQAARQLHYPLQPLSCHPAKKPLNLVIIVIDTWRFDMLTPKITPRIYNFSKTNLVFNNHYSGGNSTRPGIFTLFYGIPANYWTATVNQHVRPVLFDELFKQHYQLGIYASAELHIPAFNENIFYGVKHLNLETPGDTPKKRDIYITKEFKKFIKQTQKKPQPFFSFLFYDAAHSYCKSQFNGPFKPAIKVCNRLTLSDNNKNLYINRYKNALYFIDGEIAKDLALLKQNDLLKNTVVIITGDHGQEFNDNHLGYWGHASNFTHFQVQTPLVIHWPGKTAAVYHYRTTHFDIAPTLMKQFFNCTNPPQDYSVGYSLFSKGKRSNLIIGSYTSFGVIEPNRIVTIFPSGDYQISTLDGRPLTNAKLNNLTLQQVFRDLRRFYR